MKLFHQIQAGPLRFQQFRESRRDDSTAVQCAAGNPWVPTSDCWVSVSESGAGALLFVPWNRKPGTCCWVAKQSSLIFPEVYFKPPFDDREWGQFWRQHVFQWMNISCFDPSLFPTDFGGDFRTTKRCPRLNFFVPQFIFFTVSNSMTIEMHWNVHERGKKYDQMNQIHLGMVLSRTWDFMARERWKKNLFPRLEPHPKLQSFSRGHIRSDADVLQRMEVQTVQLKLCGNELQTFGQVVSKRSKMTKLNIIEYLFAWHMHLFVYHCVRGTKCSGCSSRWVCSTWQKKQAAVVISETSNWFRSHTTTNPSWTEYFLNPCLGMPGSDGFSSSVAMCFRGAWLLCLARLLLHFEYPSSGQFFFFRCDFRRIKLTSVTSVDKKNSISLAVGGLWVQEYFENVPPALTQTSALAGHFQCLCLHCERDLFEQAETNMEPSGYLPNQSG